MRKCTTPKNKRFSKRLENSQGKEKVQSMTKMEILNYLRTCIKEGSLKEDDFFGSAVFYRLAGRYPDLSILHCIDVVDQIRDEMF